MKKFIAAMICLTAFSAQASLISYSDRSTFDGLYNGLSVEDFEDITSISQVLASSNIEAGLTLSLTSGVDAYLANPGQSSNPTKAIGINTPRSAGWVMDFSTSVYAVSFDVFQNNGGGSQFGYDIFADVDVFGAGGLMGSFVTPISSGQAGFFGVFSDSDLITRVVVNEVNSFDVIDNIAFGTAAPQSVPEPSSIAVLGLSLLAFGMMRRKA